MNGHQINIQDGGTYYSPKKTFIVLNANNCHSIINDFCQKQGISLKSKLLPSELAEFGIFMSGISHKKAKRVIAELNLYEHKNNPNHLDEFEKGKYEWLLIKEEPEEEESEEEESEGEEPEEPEEPEEEL